MAKLEKQDSGFMLKLANFIVKKRNFIFLFYIFAVVFSIFSMGWVNVENDVTVYLPKNTETRQGLIVMNENFVATATAQVMVNNVSLETAHHGLVTQFIVKTLRLAIVRYSHMVFLMEMA